MRWPWAARLDGGEQKRHLELEQVVDRMELVAARLVSTADRLERVVGELEDKK